MTVHATKLPNDLPPDRLILRASGAGMLEVDPQRAGWRYLGCRILHVDHGASIEVGRGGRESAIVIVGGGGLEALWPGGGADLPGRRSVWDGLPWGLYLPPGRTATLKAVGLSPDRPVTIAIAEAPPAGRPTVASGPVVISPDPAMVEIRGAGDATRQITHIIKPEFPADRLLSVEVYTPGGNWSGWPPHQHDVDDMPHEAVLEETYYYRIRRPEGWALQRLYRRDGTRDAMWAVRDGDLVFMPDGIHPFSAPPAYDCYYLNFLAGDRRTMANREDPDLAWVRDTFATTAPDPRLPLVSRPDALGPR
jgi:5-deoxy-glucuronate isomerase